MSDQQPAGTVLARYLTPVGEQVDITHVSHSGLLLATCTGCPWSNPTDTGGKTYDPPEAEDIRVDKALPEAREHAQAHAEHCRAIPLPKS